MWRTTLVKTGYVFGEELNSKLVTEGPNEKNNFYPGELGDGTTPSMIRPKCGPKQLTKITERNMKICEKRVCSVKFHVGSKAHYFWPCRYVYRWPKRQCNYSGPFFVVKIHWPEAVSIQRWSQRSDVPVVSTEKLKLFLCKALWLVRRYRWAFGTHVTGTIVAPVFRARPKTRPTT